jgi:hypothetical protein
MRKTSIEMQFVERCQCLLLHAVEGVELFRHLESRRFVFSQQAFDAERHVGESTGGVEARRNHKAEIAGRKVSWFSTSNFE